MKKIFVSILAATAFICLGATAEAQQQKDKQTPSNQYRTTKKSDKTSEPVDSTLNRAEDGMRRTGQEAKEGVEETGDNLQRASEETGEDIRQGVEGTGSEIRKDVREVRDDVKERVQSREEAGVTHDDNLNETNESGVTEPTLNDVEVVDGKEGPHGEVVYKFLDGYYVIDKVEAKKLVKLNASDLKDSKHHVKVSVSTTRDSKSKGKKSSKG